MKTRRRIDTGHSSGGFFVSFSKAFEMFGSPRTLSISDQINNGTSIDAKALYGDWKNVGTDIRSAMNKVELEQQIH